MAYLGGYASFAEIRTIFLFNDGNADWQVNLQRLKEAAGDYTGRK
jgi:hypothetical protein